MQVMNMKANNSKFHLPIRSRSAVHYTGLAVLLNQSSKVRYYPFSICITDTIRFALIIDL